MKAALLISGYLRTIEQNINSLKEKIISQFDEVDVYIHITKDENKEDRYLNTKSRKGIEYVCSNLNPKTILYESNELFAANSKENDTINLWSKYYKLNQVKKTTEKMSGRYDLVIKYRPDMHIISDLDFSSVKNNVVYLPEDDKVDQGKLTNFEDPHVCDILAFGSSEIMDQYFGIYDNLTNLIKTYGTVSETLLFHHIRETNISHVFIDLAYNMILSTCNVFAICGDSGSGKTTLGERLKKHFSKSFMLECDRYHKWERGNLNWKAFTHLNPDANYITKMNKDIFDLKIGQDVYQVDYSHETGTFTPKEKISATDHLIVCGLHSLYLDNDSVYNIKVYMDTDERLKYAWKCERDIVKRGYTKEQVLKQIEGRREDYEKYILPQKEKCDVVVRFYYDETNTKNNNLSLAVSINKQYDVSNILKTFSKYSIPFELQKDNKNRTLIFKEYKKSDLWDHYSDGSDSFYDYVLYVLLHVVDKPL